MRSRLILTVLMASILTPPLASAQEWPAEIRPFLPEASGVVFVAQTRTLLEGLPDPIPEPLATALRESPLGTATPGEALEALAISSDRPLLLTMYTPSDVDLAAGHERVMSVLVGELPSSEHLELAHQLRLSAHSDSGDAELMGDLAARFAALGDEQPILRRFAARIAVPVTDPAPLSTLLGTGRRPREECLPDATCYGNAISGDIQVIRAAPGYLVIDIVSDQDSIAIEELVLPLTPAGNPRVEWPTDGSPLNFMVDAETVAALATVIGFTYMSSALQSDMIAPEDRERILAMGSALVLTSVAVHWEQAIDWTLTSNGDQTLVRLRSDRLPETPESSFLIDVPGAAVGQFPVRAEGTTWGGLLPPLVVPAAELARLFQEGGMWTYFALPTTASRVLLGAPALVESPASALIAHGEDIDSVLFVGVADSTDVKVIGIVADDDVPATRMASWLGCVRAGVADDCPSQLAAYTDTLALDETGSLYFHLGRVGSRNVFWLGALEADVSAVAASAAPSEGSGLAQVQLPLDFLASFLGEAAPWGISAVLAWDDSGLTWRLSKAD